MPVTKDAIMAGALALNEADRRELIDRLTASLDEPADGIDETEIAELKSLVDVGLAEADRGQFTKITAEEVIAERRASFDQRGGRR